MKNFAKFLTIAILGLAFSVNVSAQSANATATATIVTPISIAKTGTDMNFGNVIAGAGTVVLTPAGGRSATGAVTFLPSLPGTISAAVFTVSGQAGAGYAITLPGSVTIDDGATHTMTVDGFTSNPNATGTIGGGGTQALTVGATLNVNAGQTPGVYTTTAPGFAVTVNYN